MPKIQWKPYLALTAGVLALSFSGLFIRWADAPGPVTSFYRMALASIFLLPVFIRKVRTNGAPPLRYLLFPLAGGLFTSLDHAFWSTSVKYTQIGTATLLNNIAPLWVALVAALFLSERLRRRFWLGLVLTLAGAALVFGSDLLLNPHLSRGDVIALFSSLFYAGYFLSTQGGRRRLETFTYTWLLTTVSAVALLTGTQALGMPLGGYSRGTYLVFLGAALVSQIGGYFSVGYALGYLPASRVSPTMIAQPVLTALLAIPLAGESLVAGQVVGGLAVLSGIFLINTGRAAPGADQERPSVWSRASSNRTAACSTSIEQGLPVDEP